MAQEETVYISKESKDFLNMYQQKPVENVQKWNLSVLDQE